MYRLMYVFTIGVVVLISTLCFGSVTLIVSVVVGVPISVK